MKKKLTKRRLNYLIKDEKESAKEYRSYGLYSIAKDEAKHRRILNKLKMIKRR